MARGEGKWRRRWLLLSLATVLGATAVVLPAIASSEATVEAKSRAGGIGYEWSPSGVGASGGGQITIKNPSASVYHGVEWKSGPETPSCSAGVPVGKGPASSARNWSGTCTFTKPGTYVFWCTVHGSEMTETVTVGTPPTPTVSAVTPNTGPEVGGTPVTITGKNLAGATAVRFGSTDATSFKVESESSVAAVSPAGKGMVHVTVTTAGGTSEQTEADLFSYGLTAPTVKTKPASPVSETSATLNATVNPNGSMVSECFFEYGETTSYGSTMPCSTSPGSGSSPVAVSAAVASLKANTIYHFRIAAKNSGGTSKGLDESLKTIAAPVAPTVVTNAASEVGESSAKLNATVNPNGSMVSECFFEYGESTSYTASVPCSTSPGSGSSPVAVSATIAPLTANSTYHFRVVAKNSGGSSKGLDESFKTSASAAGGGGGNGGGANTGGSTGGNAAGAAPPSGTSGSPGGGVLGFTSYRAGLASTSLSASQSGAVAVKVACLGSSSCAGNVTLRTLNAVSASTKKSILTLASASFSLAGGQTKSLTLHLSSKARKLLARVHVLKARATIVARDASGAVHTTAMTVTLRLAKRHH